MKLFHDAGYFTPKIEREKKKIDDSSFQMSKEKKADENAVSLSFDKLNVTQKDEDKTNAALDSRLISSKVPSHCKTNLIYIYINR